MKKSHRFGAIMIIIVIAFLVLVSTAYIGPVKDYGCAQQSLYNHKWKDAFEAKYVICQRSKPAGWIYPGAFVQHNTKQVTRGILIEGNLIKGSSNYIPIFRFDNYLLAFNLIENKSKIIFIDEAGLHLTKNDVNFINLKNVVRYSDGKLFFVKNDKSLNTYDLTNNSIKTVDDAINGLVNGSSKKYGIIIPSDPENVIVKGDPSDFGLKYNFDFWFNVHQSMFYFK